MVAEFNLAQNCAVITRALLEKPLQIERSGILCAIRSDCHLDATKLTSARKGSGNKYSRLTAGSLPTVNYQVLPQSPVGFAVNNAYSCVENPLTYSPVNLSFPYAHQMGNGVSIPGSFFDNICYGVGDALAASGRGNEVSTATNYLQIHEATKPVLPVIGNRIATGVKSFLKTSAIQAMVAGQGLNPVTGSTGTALWSAKDANGQLNNQTIANLESLMGVLGCDTSCVQFIAGNGSIVNEFKRLLGNEVRCCGSNGINYNALYDGAKFNNWYTESALGQVAGTSSNDIFIVHPNAIALNFAYVNEDYWYQRVANTFFDTMEIADLNCFSDCEEVAMLEVRYTEAVCVGGVATPSWTMHWDAQAGIWVRPFGTYHDSGLYQAFNGLIHIRLQ